MPADRWEVGSDFEISLEGALERQSWLPPSSQVWGCGRDAARALLRWGRETQAWRRLLVPSYFCQVVVGALCQEIMVAAYDHWPLLPGRGPLETERGDAVLVPAYYGLPPDVEIRGPGVIIEDHTHDPFAPSALGSDAHYALASLRKTLPLPDGGILWSPRGLELPPSRPASARHERAAFHRLSAMALKLDYLAGRLDAKEAFRLLAIKGEQDLAKGNASGMSAYSLARLPTFPIADWRRRRADNLAAFRAALGELPGVMLLPASFAAMLVFDSAELAERVRVALMAERIYPSILWSLDHPVVAGIPADHVALARRMLAIACDQRYGPADMERVAGHVRVAVETSDVKAP